MVLKAIWEGWLGMKNWMMKPIPRIKNYGQWYIFFHKYLLILNEC